MIESPDEPANYTNTIGSSRIGFGAHLDKLECGVGNVAVSVMHQRQDLGNQAAAISNFRCMY